MTEQAQPIVTGYIQKGLSDGIPLQPNQSTDGLAPWSPHAPGGLSANNTYKLY